MKNTSKKYERAGKSASYLASFSSSAIMDDMLERVLQKNFLEKKTKLTMITDLNPSC